MATLVLLNEFVELNAVNSSGWAKSGALAMEAAALDASVFGDGWTKNTAGLKSGTLTIEFLDDFAASQLDATLWPLFGTVVPFKLRPDAGAVSTSNPQYSGNVLIAQHNVGGSLGELAGKSLSFPLSGAVARATS
ncbi:hypothetical protein [Planobispora longispora]|uniref:Uncharacterized protein n=1 Tax=Planobispora longispora TaxID=28887 RepID=A0A8J3RPV1_9ACTN|nr:hypothetical protein [Planobispora longispora]BFE85830.1 hypothetical protein GCM10020093_084310 [Planobispora longispora]GIH76138.1 hypothetical protein Plo01_25670 [Planobispora longispora]